MNFLPLIVVVSFVVVPAHFVFTYLLFEHFVERSHLHDEVAE